MGYNRNFRVILASSLLAAGLAVPSFAAPRQMENLTRGLVASNVGKGMLVSWRLLGTDDPATEFKCGYELFRCCRLDDFQVHGGCRGRWQGTVSNCTVAGFG